MEKERILAVINKYLEDAKDSYNVWLNEYDRTGSDVSEEQMLQNRQKITLLENMINDINYVLHLDPDKRYDE